MKKAIIPLTALLFLVCVATASACISYPTLLTKKSLGGLSFPNYRNETAVISLLEEKKEFWGHTDQDIPVIADFIKNGYNVKEQTDTEYEEFLEEAKEANKGMCPPYEAISRNGKWTGFIAHSLTYDRRTGNCIGDRCSSAASTIIWNDLPEGGPGILKRIWYFFLRLF